MKAIVVTEQGAGTAGMKLVERPDPRAAINDVVVQVHASGFGNTELDLPDGLDRGPARPAVQRGLGPSPISTSQVLA